jgi:predicted  nucleic acid-binding Zn-ribbon protein
MGEWVIIGGIVAAIASMINAWSTKQKFNTESQMQVAKTAVEMMDGMRIDLDKLKSENSELRSKLDEVNNRLKAVENRNDRLNSDITLLCAQITNLGHVPMIQQRMREG